MNNDEIESRIRDEIHRTTPDILDSLMDELSLDKDATTVESVPLRRPHHAKRWHLAALPAAAAIILVAISIVTTSNLNREAFAIVGLDVNPSIEISIDANERVLSAEALNDDAAIVLDGLELEKTDLNTACHAVIGSMLVKGYLRADSNSILVTISSPDGEKGKALEREVSGNLKSYMQDSGIEVAILGQYIEENRGLEHFADENGISLGKARLVEKLLALGTLKADEASLLKLSTQELILLAQERNVEAETSIGSSDTSKYIARDKAIRIALEDAGLQEQEASELRAEFDCEDSIIVYEIEFLNQSGKWEYEIEARSGQILSSEVEARNVAIPAASEDKDDEEEDDDDDDDDGDDGDDDVAAGRDDEYFDNYSDDDEDDEDDERNNSNEDEDEDDDDDDDSDGDSDDSDEEDD